jgi:hypothetical protein
MAFEQFVTCTGFPWYYGDLNFMVALLPPYNMPALVPLVDVAPVGYYTVGNYKQF